MAGQNDDIAENRKNDLPLNKMTKEQKELIQAQNIEMTDGKLTNNAPTDTPPPLPRTPNNKDEAPELNAAQKEAVRTASLRKMQNDYKNTPIAEPKKPSFWSKLWNAITSIFGSNNKKENTPPPLPTTRPPEKTPDDIEAEKSLAKNPNEQSKDGQDKMELPVLQMKAKNIVENNKTTKPSSHVQKLQESQNNKSNQTIGK